jgi:hypothetical protein
MLLVLSLSKEERTLKELVLSLSKDNFCPTI